MSRSFPVAVSAAARLLVAASLASLALSACGERSRDRAAEPTDDRQLQVAPAKPEPAMPVAPVAPAVAAKAPKATASANVVETAKEEPVAPDEQVQQDAAASGMTSRTTTTSTTTTERSSSMSNLY